MRIKRTTPRSGMARRTRLIAVTTGLVAAAALAVPTANAERRRDVQRQPAHAPRATPCSSADVAGTAWNVDPTTKTLVVVTVDSTVSQAEIAKIKKAAGANAGALRIERTPGTFNKLISGGDAIYAHQLALLARLQRPQRQHLLLPDRRSLHRRQPGTWYTNSANTTSIGPTAGSSFPTNDYGIVRYTNTSVAHAGTVGSAGHHQRGQRHRRHVRHPPRLHHRHPQRHASPRLNATVNYGGGDIVYGMIQTNVCAEPGDSGGPLYSGTRAHRSHLGRQRQLQLRRHDVLPAGHRGAQRLRRQRLLTPGTPRTFSKPRSATPEPPPEFRAGAPVHPAAFERMWGRTVAQEQRGRMLCLPEGCPPGPPADTPGGSSP